MIEVYREAAKKTIGVSKKQSKPWIRGDTWRRVDARKALKIKLEGARSERLKERLSGEYRSKDREVKRSTREDKRNSMEERAKEAERAAEKYGRSKELYKITKLIIGKSKETVCWDKGQTW